MTRDRQITGRHVAMIFVSAFAVIIAVNLLLAFSAVKTFPGLEVKNSYIASQTFDDRRQAQHALGWEINASAERGALVLSIRDSSGHPVEAASLHAVVGRATHVKDDFTPEFLYDGQDYVARASLAEGNWNMRMTATAQDGTTFEQRVVLHVER
ncbi:FixH family protein [Cognatishimia activa]|uniref:Putative integral membrane protein linked to a cation pump n=1 Tax=Cognatishimia activa TaxID=1715691 RepID=A0A0N7MBQ1_9RHOB|nr:FixH family protein [Cognatishimia activa]MEE2944487.1 FixH family protein [Pseudomonadota bacterium]CUJ05727.1 putative integral membrane protein linked to a cation pump [Cognatishimia activa]CUK26032.1 putative integral membrane protein linked to a cation pump [Cognatishimia activa]